MDTSNTDKKFSFWQRWLTYANVLTIIIGLLVAFAGNSIFLKIHNSYSSELFFSSDHINIDVLHYKNFLYGIIGGTIVGFHVLMVMISENAFKKREKWAYYAMWYGLLSWFIIDSSISFFYGAIFNIAMINLPALILIGLPLVMTRKVFL